MPERANVGSRTPAGLAEYALQSLSFGGDAAVPSRPPPGFARLEPENEDITPLLIEAAKRGLLGSSIATGLAGASGIRTLSPLVEDAAIAQARADTLRAGVREGSLLPSSSTVDPYNYGGDPTDWTDRAAYRKRVSGLYPEQVSRLASIPDSPVDSWWASRPSPGYYSPDVDQKIRKIVYDETVGGGRRMQNIEKAKGVVARGRALMAQQAATKALVSRAALGAVAAPGAAYAGHKSVDAPTGGFIRKLEGYEGALTSAEMDPFIDAQQAEKEELRREYVDEVNSRFGPGTVSQDARIEELRDYLGPIR